MPHCGTLLLHAQLNPIAVKLDLVQPLLASWRTRHQHRMLGRYEGGHGSRWFAGSHVSERGTEPFGAPFPVYESRFQCLFAAGVLDRFATCGGTLRGMRRGDRDEQHLSGSVRRGISDRLHAVEGCRSQRAGEQHSRTGPQLESSLERHRERQRLGACRSQRTGIASAALHGRLYPVSMSWTKLGD